MPGKIPETGKDEAFISNNFDLAAKTKADISTNHWEVKLLYTVTQAKPENQDVSQEQPYCRHGPTQVCPYYHAGIILHDVSCQAWSISATDPAITEVQPI
ncbi:MAG: hypothetical protein CSA33_09115 [Desulfobulbus propionicus]|nr:MAG: hypothetical protein CSA33_09115 [Desulfobulbus propionicus]